MFGAPDRNRTCLPPFMRRPLDQLATSAEMAPSVGIEPTYQILQICANPSQLTWVKIGSPTTNRTWNVWLEAISYIHLTMGPFCIVSFCGFSSRRFCANGRVYDLHCSLDGVCTLDNIDVRLNASFSRQKDLLCF